MTTKVPVISHLAPPSLRLIGHLSCPLSSLHKGAPHMKKSDASYTALALDKNASKHPSFPHRASVLTILLVCFLVAALYLSAPSLGISLPSSLSVDYFTYRSWKTKDLSHFAHYVW